MDNMSPKLVHFLIGHQEFSTWDVELWRWTPGDRNLLPPLVQHGRKMTHGFSHEPVVDTITQISRGKWKLPIEFPYEQRIGPSISI